MVEGLFDTQGRPTLPLTQRGCTAHQVAPRSHHRSAHRGRWQREGGHGQDRHLSFDQTAG